MNLIRSTILPVPHGFSTRAGGVSGGVHASLNLGYSVGDDPAHVTENLRRLARALEVSPSRLRAVSQVHGATVLRAGPGSGADSDELLAPIGEADAVWTDSPGVAVGVKTADCVPILLS